MRSKCQQQPHATAALQAAPFSSKAEDVMLTPRNVNAIAATPTAVAMTQRGDATAKYTYPRTHYVPTAKSKGATSQRQRFTTPPNYETAALDSIPKTAVDSASPVTAREQSEGSRVVQISEAKGLATAGAANLQIREIGNDVVDLVHFLENGSWA